MDGSLGAVVGRAAACVLDLLAPALCAGCEAADGLAAGLCEQCRRQLRNCAPVKWWLCLGELAVPAFAAARYDGSTRAILLAYKERGRQALRHELGGALSSACLAACSAGWLAAGSAVRADREPNAVLLVPVPSRGATVRARGHDAVRAVANVAAARLRSCGVSAAVAPLLRHARVVADQAGLTIEQRAANLAGALTVRRPERVRARTVIVVDDIVTTGATATEAVRALSERGAVVAAVAAIAATPRRSPPRSSSELRSAAPGIGPGLG